MPIPPFHELLMPLLKFMNDGRIRRHAEIVEFLGRHFAVSDAEFEELLPSGKQARFDNRVRWAVVHLRKAGLLASPKRGEILITDLGRQTVKSGITAIDVAYLERFPAYASFRSADIEPTEAAETSKRADEETPEESIGRIHATLRRQLADDILENVKACSPRFFERLVVELLSTMGYGRGLRDLAQVTGKSGDGGIDGVIREDKLGLDIVAIQAKRWDRSVGRPEVQAFAGSLEGARSRKGVFITTSTFTRDARDYVKNIDKRIVLIDGEELAQMMIDYGVGVIDRETYTIKKLDAGFFAEE